MQIRRLLTLTFAFTVWMAAPGGAQTPSVAPSIMAVLFLEAQRADTIEAWTAFLEICEDSPYCDLAETARTALLPKPAAPVVAKPVAPAPEPAPIAEAPASDPVTPEVPAVAVAVPEAEPAPTPAPKPQPAKRIASPKPKPKPRAQPQVQPRQPDPEHTGSISKPLPGTQTRPTGLIRESASETSQTQKPSAKPKAAGMRSSAEKRGLPPRAPD